MVPALWGRQLWEQKALWVQVWAHQWRPIRLLYYMHDFLIKFIMGKGFGRPMVPNPMYCS